MSRRESPPRTTPIAFDHLHPTSAPIFIHGILPRSGTNFLWDLLLVHPDCAPAVEPVREDLFLEHCHHLTAFIADVQAAWDPMWGEFSAELPRRLHAALGEGLLSFLRYDRDRRLVTKSPSVRHLDRFFDFFPTARLLVLVRDGRSVTQSCMDTFGWPFERAARAWVDAAAEIDRFRDARPDPTDQWRLVRYEDLVDDLDRQLPELLRFLGLDLATYDLDAARALPVRGSSAFFGRGRSSVHWDPVDKDSRFAPTQRWHHWNRDQLERFAWIAGTHLRSFGYDAEPMPSAVLTTRARHRLLDLRWATRQAVRRARTGLGAASQPLRRRLAHARQD
ncbi:MAG: sulfotransferase [Actinomycetota bacterium]|nr:sulfotransferase [Actinomycetota bacterium]